ncbi:hypothetical protein G6O69_07355 [Pseudenhygromyxa sp. WMMC2535]|uniref:hypothetical protein n=1 Tax=Pseudenhygromyxa sp. WMMC2535 TaxID=2712867 RepID=UPI001556E4BE|nr:hypothetical protein [Pseudenhygromyxa sp. WMMC2535]NVB37644.1 hypothetical protein [Pseudenhygromyxa sp. WMMC2535]
MSANRRRHRVFFTRHSEYHLRNDECVGVRDRSTGMWMVDHAALRLHALQLPEVPDSEAWLGRRIQFWGRASDVVTSPVVAVGRPEIDEVGAYVSQARAGVIAEQPCPRLQTCLPA